MDFHSLLKTPRLTNTSKIYILICMKTTLNIRGDLLEKARQLTGIKKKTALVHLGLETLIQQAARERLIQLGSSDLKAHVSARRRYKK